MEDWNKQTILERFVRLKQRRCIGEYLGHENAFSQRRLNPHLSEALPAFIQHSREQDGLSQGRHDGESAVIEFSGGTYLQVQVFRLPQLVQNRR